MNEAPFRDELLKQNSSAALGMEMDGFKKLIEAEHRRSTKLLRWTIGIWAGWVVLLLMGLLYPAISYAFSSNANRPPIATTQQSTDAAAAPAPAQKSIGKAVVVSIYLIGVTAMPVAGMILLVMTFLSTRSANAAQIRASLASIETQLAVLMAQRK